MRLKSTGLLSSHSKVLVSKFHNNPIHVALYCGAIKKNSSFCCRNYWVSTNRLRVNGSQRPALPFALELRLAEISHVSGELKGLFERTKPAGTARRRSCRCNRQLGSPALLSPFRTGILLTIVRCWTGRRSFTRSGFGT